ncbi:hypothetical protein EV144_1011183 [Flavobacterium sp. 270]|uniref:hypothetical protein n=1 Tax=Flavobacterium sp. 270 TaxID=2512114 RepID=UPI001066342F|nr:hypothetical protein [Flavobacterium sp. 270]TDW52493.1 hypothetical protein EV144_1011183 [Flavobacterium sp. 270]
MPLSRGRKSKNKKKTPKKKRTNSNYEEFNTNGVKVYRQGKNVFLQTNRTQEQQNELIESIKKNRPQLLDTLKVSIDRITEIFSNYDNFQLLGGLCYNLFVNHDNSEDDGASQLAVEYGLSFSTALKNNPKVSPTSEILNELIELLLSTRQTYNHYVMTEFVDSKNSEIENHLRYKTILESLFMRGNGYMQHIYTIFEELFSGHDDFLHKHYGFNTADILETILQLEDSYYCRVILENGIPHWKAYERFKEWQKAQGIASFLMGDDKPMINFLVDNPDFVSTQNKPSGYGINDIAQFEELYKIRYRKPIHKKIVESLSIEFGDNLDFLNPKFSGLPLNDSQSNLKPVISYGGSHYLFGFNVLTNNLFSITEKLILDADKVYYEQKFLGNKYSKSRDNYLENKTFKLFSKFIPNSLSYLNLKYRPGQVDKIGNKIETELDLLIVSDKANYIIEMKAGGLSAPSKRGALKSLSGQLSETVGYGAYQSHRAYKYIQDDSNPEFYDDKKNIIVVDKLKKTFRITITLEHLSGYIANIHELKIMGVIEKDIEFAWTCSLFDLMIFSEIIENEDDFIEYLEKRIPLYNNPNIDVDDEIDFLGYFLDTGDLVDRKALKKVSSFRLNKASQEIDLYFQKGGTKPKRKK